MRHPTEGLFLSAVFLTNFASGMIQIASTKAIFDGTGKTSDVALAVSMQLICQLVAQFLAGSLVDRFSSKSIAVLSRALVMTGVAISAFFAFKDSSSLSIAGAIPLFLMSVLQPFIHTADFATIGKIVSSGGARRFYGFQTIAVQSGQLLGCAAVGLLMKWCGIVWSMTAASCAFGAGAFFLSFVRTNSASQSYQNKNLDTWRYALESLLKSPPLVRSMVLTLISALIVHTFNTMLIPVVSALSSGSPISISILDVSYACGALTAGWMISKRMVETDLLLKWQHAAPLFLAATAAAHAVSISMGASLGQFAILAFLLALGSASLCALAMSQVQILSEASCKGRIAAMHQIFLSIASASLIPLIGAASDHSLQYGYWALTLILTCLFILLLIRKPNETLLEIAPTIRTQEALEE